MNFDFLDRRSAERFAELLDETSGGRRHHTRGQADEQLAELVAIGSSLSAARSGVQVDTEFRVGLRAMLVATAERDGIGRTAAETEDEPTGLPVREPARGLFGRGSGRRIRARGAIVIGVAAGAMAVSGISAASENASPGDALYGVKRSTEKAQLAMAGSDVTRGQLSLDFARTRLAEAAAMRGTDPAFARVLQDMDADTRQGVKLLTGSSVARRDTAPLSTVDSFVTTQRRTVEPVLNRLSPGNRQRGLESLSLLDDAHRRADDLRAGLACDAVVPAGSDSLGPKLADCGTGPGPAVEPDRSPGAGPKPGTRGGSPTTGSEGRTGSQTARPERTDPTAEPGVTGPANEPADDTPTRPGVAPTTGGATPTPSTAPDDTGTGEDEGLLDGILGGIFG